MSVEENKQYIQEQIDPIFTPLLHDILIMKPQNIVYQLQLKILTFGKYSFIAKWCLQKGQIPREEISVVSSPEQMTELGSEYSESNSEDDEYFDEEKLQVTNFSKQRAARQSVSAESFGSYNKKKAYVPKIVPKSKEQMKEIRGNLMDSFMFQNLNVKDLQIVIDVMEYKEFKRGDIVIKEGDDGNELFVVQEGQLECTKIFVPGQKPTFLKLYEKGGSFGELALLYNAPRAASIQALNDCMLLSLNRECFNSIVKNSAIERRKHYLSFITRVELLSKLNSYEKVRICDAVNQEIYSEGDYIVRQGQSGHTMYFIVSGSIVATKLLEIGGQDEVVYTYKEGDYFGELALLKDQPRQANILCRTDAVILSLERSSFKRLFGPLKNLLERNTSVYKGYNH